MWADISAGRITQSPVVRALTCLSCCLVFIYTRLSKIFPSQNQRWCELQNCNSEDPRKTRSSPVHFPKIEEEKTSDSCGAEPAARTKPVKNHTWTHGHPLPADPLLFLQLHWPAWFFSINAAIPFFLLGNERVKMVFNSSTLAPWASKAITTETGKWKNRAPAPKLCLQTVPMLRKRVHCAVQNSISHLAIQEKKNQELLNRNLFKKNKIK